MATVILGTAIMYFAGRAIYPKSEIESGGRSAENIDYYKPGSAAETGGEAGALSGGAAAASEPAVHESDDAMARYEEIDRMFASGEVIDMTRDKPAVLKGKLSDDLTHFWLDEENGIWRSQIEMFFEENGRQYGSASYVLKKQDGSEKNVSTIGFTREH